MRGPAFLRKPVSPAVAEAKLRAAETIFGLEDAWALFCDHFPDESDARKHLYDIYMDRAAQFSAEAGRYLRAG